MDNISSREEKVRKSPAEGSGFIYHNAGCCRMCSWLNHVRKDRSVWNEDISCHSNIQEMSQPSEMSGLQMWMRASQTAMQQMLPFPLGTAEKLGDTGSSHLPLLQVNKEKKEDWPQIAEVHYERSSCSEPRGLHLPIPRMHHSLTWYLVFLTSQ